MITLLILLFIAAFAAAMIIFYILSVFIMYCQLKRDAETTSITFNSYKIVFTDALGEIHQTDELYALYPNRYSYYFSNRKSVKVKEKHYIISSLVSYKEIATDKSFTMTVPKEFAKNHYNDLYSLNNLEDMHACNIKNATAARMMLANKWNLLIAPINDFK